MKRIEIEIHKLCNEIDHYKAEAEYWKSEFEKERQERLNMINETHESTKRSIAQALSFALTVEDKPDGSLSISKENRMKLAENYK